MRRPVSVAIVLLVLMGLQGTGWAEAASYAGEPAAEIGPSVSFSQGAGPSFSLSDLRGKVVVVVFFQSWCGICNGWSPAMFKQLEEAAADKPEVVVLAVKTDGGDYNSALKYIQARTKDPSKWLIATDSNATWYQVALGTDELYSYMIIDPEGTILFSGYAGSFFRADKPGAEDQFTVGVYLKRFLAQTEPETILPVEKTYHDSLGFAVHAVELRQFKLAWQLCSKASGKEAKASAAELKQDLTDWATERVESLKTLLADEGSSREERFDAYLELQQIADGLAYTEPGKAARKLAQEAARDKGVQAELEAQKAYLDLMKKAAGSADKLAGNKGFAQALMAIAGKYMGTRYGTMAEADAERIAP